MSLSTLKRKRNDLIDKNSKRQRQLYDMISKYTLVNSLVIRILTSLYVYYDNIIN